VDVVVTDLTVPGSDGFLLIAKIQDLVPDKSIRVIVLTDLTEDNSVRRALSLGVEYYMLKPFDPDVIRQRVIDPLPPWIPCFQGEDWDWDAIQTRTPECGPPHPLDGKIADILFTLGIPAHIKGYYFLREAVKIMVDNPDIINAITKELYPAVAGRFNTSPLRVERAICHAINVGWGKNRMGQMAAKPTNGRLIAQIADDIILDCLA
jgi:two-component system response regulator (stage 0 sporulation protein A)